MASREPDVSIILVSWNTRDLLLGCLASLTEAVGNIQADLWVVDNASSDGSADAVRRQFREVQVLENHENRGFAGANNQAIVMSRSRYVLLLNSDTLPARGSIEQLVRFADFHPHAAVVGPMLRNPDDSFQGSFADFPSLHSELFNVTGIGKRVFGLWYPNYSPRDSLHARRVDVIQGACMLVRRCALDEVGLIDENYFMYSEEFDWCLRMWRHGWEVWYMPGACVRHYGGQSTSQMRSVMLRALYRSKVRFFRKHYGKMPACVLQTLFVCVLRLKWLTEVLGATHMDRSHVGWPVAWDDLQGKAIAGIELPPRRHSQR